MDDLTLVEVKDDEEDYLGGKTFDEIQKDAESKNCTVVLPAENELQLDLDDEASLKVYAHANDVFLPQLNIIQKDTWASKSGHRHVILQTAVPLSVHERILLQACFGSDRKRELLSYMNVLDEAEHPVLLFRPKV